MRNQLGFTLFRSSTWAVLIPPADVFKWLKIIDQDSTIRSRDGGRQAISRKNPASVIQRALHRDVQNAAIRRNRDRENSFNIFCAGAVKGRSFGPGTFEISTFTTL